MKEGADTDMEINDPVEMIVAAALDARGITYRHDAPLDFECGDFAIEVKAFSMYCWGKINKR